MSSNSYPGKGKTTIASRKPDNNVAVTFLVAANHMGSAILTLSSSYARTGTGVGLAVTAFVVWLSLITYNVVIEAATLSGSTAYQQIVKFYFGSKFSNLVSFGILFSAIGYLSAYVLIIGEYISSSLLYFVDETADWMTDLKLIRLVIVICVFIPLASLTNIRFLAPSSYISLFCIGMIILSVLFTFGKRWASSDLYETDVFFDEPLVAFKALPNIIGSYGCQMYLPVVMTSMNNPNAEHMKNNTFKGVLIVTVINVLIAVGGYYAFGSTVPDNILQVSEWTGNDVPWYVTISRTGFILVLCSIHTITVWPARSALISLLKCIFGSAKGKVSSRDSTTSHQKIGSDLRKSISRDRKVVVQRKQRQKAEFDAMHYDSLSDSDEEISTSDKDSTSSEDKNKVDAEESIEIEMEEDETDFEIGSIVMEKDHESDEICTSDVVLNESDLETSCSISLSADSDVSISEETTENGNIVEIEMSNEKEKEKNAAYETDQEAFRRKWNVDEEAEAEEEKKMTKNELLAHIGSAILISFIAFGITILLSDLSSIFGIFISIFGSFVGIISVGIVQLKMRKINHVEACETGALPKDAPFPKKQYTLPIVVITFGFIVMIVGVVSVFA